jgi:hypothetical protein
MRGHGRCRAHRDDELGPRGAGAPSHNLNALKHGRHSRPLSQPDLERLADQILEAPGDLPYRLGLAAQSLQVRTPDPLATLLALRRLLSQLANLVAGRLVAAELRAVLDALPPELRGRTAARIAGSAPRRSPVETLFFLRRVRKQLPEQNDYQNWRELMRPPGPTSEDIPPSGRKNAKKQLPVQNN